MKKTTAWIAATLAAFTLHSQIEIDQAINLTGSDGTRKITNLELPTEGSDAANKDYVDASASASGEGSYLPTVGDGSLPTRMSAESGSTMTFLGAVDYCRNLSESGFDDWRIPTFDEVIYLRSSDALYANIPSPAATNIFWLHGPGSLILGSNGSYIRPPSMNFSNSTLFSYNPDTPLRARCVR